jgi:hypothetical protein
VRGWPAQRRSDRPARAPPGRRPGEPNTRAYDAGPEVPSSLPASEFALSGTWTIGGEALTAGKDARIELNFVAADVYLDIGGTGTITRHP